MDRYQRGRSEPRDDAAQPGLRVTSADGSVYFFPGQSKELGLVLANLRPDLDLNDPECRIEFGTRRPGARVEWTLIEVVKAARRDELSDGSNF